MESLESRQLMAGEVVEVRLEALALDGTTPITQVNEGAEFLLRGRVKDLRANPQGVFQVYSDIAYESAEASPIVSEVQRIDFTGAPTGGTFTISYLGATTPPIEFQRFNQGPAQAAAIEQALEAIPALAGNVRVERDSTFNTSLPGNRYYIRFQDGLRGRDVATLTADPSGLTRDEGETAGITISEYAKGIRSNPTTFKQAFANNVSTSGDNETTRLFPDLRNAVDVVNRFDNVGGAAPLFAPPIAGYETYFVVRVGAKTGGADGALVFRNGPADTAGNDSLGIFMVGGTDPVPANQIQFTYAGSLADRLRIRVNARPTVSASGTVSYAENAAPVVLAPTATANDTDNLNFGSGRLTVSIAANVQGQDRLAIRDQGPGIGRISLSGSQVRYGATPIGGVSGGVGSFPLRINLYAGATPEAVQALVRNITYSSVSENPSVASRSIQFVLMDGAGATSLPATVNVAVTASNDGPTLSGGSSLGYKNGTAAIALAPTAIAQDPEANFAGGTLQVLVKSGAHASNRLILTQAGGITISGNDIRFGGVTIARISQAGGLGTNSLNITFTAAANLQRVQQLVRLLSFRTDTTSSSSTVQRVIEVKLTDNAGLFGTTTSTVNVS